MEDRRQKLEDGRLMTEDGREKLEDRSLEKCGVH
jgi:hypothetical protein